MSHEIRIRQAGLEDRAGLEACFDALQTFERTIEPNRVEPESIRIAYLERLFEECARTSGAIFVAEWQDRIIGFVSVLARVNSQDLIERDPEHAYVTDLVVLEAHRRSGIGLQLMQAAEAHVSACGVKRLRVGVLAANTGAHQLYRRLGYRDQEVVLEKELKDRP